MESNTTAKYVMLKLSHNARFKAIEAGNLNLPWDHIMTSTSWLKEACMTQQEGWEHTEWADNQVTIAGWYHYGHDLFSMTPSNRTYGNAKVGFTLGTLIHPHPLKGSTQAMNAIDGLKRKHKEKFQAVGFGESRVGLPEHIQYCRSLSRSDMAHSFKQLDVWLGASHSEGLGRMSLEAMSAGCAVVTTDTGAEFLKDGENCLLYPIGKAQEGAECVDRLVQDPDLFTKIVTNGFATAQATADPTVYRKNLNTVIKKVLS
jgi:glycosyltransferase involved in cell wall biosynthesis